MSKQKVKEFWIKHSQPDVLTIHAEKPEATLLTISRTRVIEYSAYEELRKAHDENVMVLRLFQDTFKRVAPEFEKLKAENEMLRKNK